jgi:hypothetical protein
MTYRAMSIRVLFLAAHMAAMVLLAAVSAGLVSSLTMQTMNLPFSTFEELFNVRTHVVGVFNNSAAMWLFNARRISVISPLTCVQFSMLCVGNYFFLGVMCCCTVLPTISKSKIVHVIFLKYLSIICTG